MNKEEYKKKLNKKQIIRISIILLVLSLLGLGDKRIYESNNNKGAIKHLQDTIEDVHKVSYNFFKNTIDLQIHMENRDLEVIKNTEVKYIENLVPEVENALETIQQEANLHGAVSDCRMVCYLWDEDTHGKIKNKKVVMTVDKNGIKFTKASGLDLEFSFK